MGLALHVGRGAERSQVSTQPRTAWPPLDGVGWGLGHRHHSLEPASPPAVPRPRV